MVTSWNLGEWNKGTHGEPIACLMDDPEMWGCSPIEERLTEEMLTVN